MQLLKEQIYPINGGDLSQATSQFHSPSKNHLNHIHLPSARQPTHNNQIPVNLDKTDLGAYIYLNNNNSSKLADNNDKRPLITQSQKAPAKMKPYVVLNKPQASHNNNNTNISSYNGRSQSTTSMSYDDTTIIDYSSAQFQ